MKYETDEYIYDFQQFQKIRPFRDSVVNGKITVSEANKKTKQFVKKTF